MAIEVKFYSYKDKPNVANKNLSSSAEATLVATRNLNFITDSKPQLKFTVECDTLYDANYVTFPYIDSTYTIPTTRTLYWFIDSIEAYKNMWLYHLQLDVLRTYWNDISSSQQMIERSYSLDPSVYLVDTLWKTGKGVDLSIAEGSGDPFKTSQSLLPPDSCIVLFAASEDTISSGRRDMVGAGGIRAFLVSTQEWHGVVASLYSTDFISAFTNVFKTRPMDVIIGAKCFPFNVASYLVGQSIDWSDSSENVDIVVGNGHKLTYTSGGADRHPYGRILKTTLCAISLGHIDITRPHGDFRDYPPYTNCKLWLPYLGEYDFDPTVYYNTGKIYIRYLVDLFSGKTTVELSNAQLSNTKTPDQYLEGVIGTDLPFGGADVETMLRNIGTSAVSAAIITAATQNIGNGMSAAAGGSGGQSKPDVPYLGPSPSAGSLVPVGEQGIELYYGNKGVNPNQEQVEQSGGRERNESPYRSIARARAVGHFLSTFSDAPRSNVHGGGTNISFMSCPQKAVLYMSTVSAVSDAYQKSLYGRLVMTPAVLNTLSGFAKITDCNIPMLGMQADVYNELVSVLESGFYIN